MSSSRRSGTRSAREGGFTMLEIAIASVIMAGMIFVVFLMLSSGTSLTSNQLIQQRIQSDVQSFIERFNGDFRASGSTVTTTTQLQTGDVFFDAANVSRYLSLRFSLQTSYDTANATTNFEQHVTYFYAPSPLEIAGNDKDDDGNGLTDDGVIKRSETDKNGNTTTTIVLHNVSENGVAFQYATGADTKDDVTLFVEALGVDPKKVKPGMDKTADKAHVFSRRMVTSVSRRTN